jgi:hypothetical protein
MRTKVMASPIPTHASDCKHASYRVLDTPVTFTPPEPSRYRGFSGVNTIRIG